MITFQPTEIYPVGWDFRFKKSILVIQRAPADLESIVESDEKDTYFPRLTFFKLDSSLIQIHLKIFSQPKYIFTGFLELRE